MSQHLLEFKNIFMEFDGETVLNDINLHIDQREFVTLLGPSGCGKTTLLRLVGGFLTPTSGHIYYLGKCIDEVPTHKRSFNTVFQKYALFPNMNVEQNIAFGPSLKKWEKSKIDQKVNEMLDLVNLSGYNRRDISTLSGGQQQRVAVARALINEPDILLLDEPLSALDLKFRKEMQTELKRIQSEVGITFLFVTHDQEEALTMSDTVVVMNGGIIQQIGTPEDIYNEPQNAFVADFIGESNIIDALMIEDRLVEILGQRFICVDEGFGSQNPVDVVIRPEDVKLSTEEGVGTITGYVTDVTFKGVHYEMKVLANDYEWLVQSTDLAPVGTKVGISVDPFNIQIMNKPVSRDEEAVPLDE